MEGGEGGQSTLQSSSIVGGLVGGQSTLQSSSIVGGGVIGGAEHSTELQYSRGVIPPYRVNQL